MTMIETTTEVPVDAIRVGERARLDLGDIGELAESIRTLGLLQPIVVRRTGDAYDLVAGGRRLEAARSLGWMLIPATVRDLNDAMALLIEAVENGHRKQFAPSEAATLGMQLEERAKAGDLDVLGNLPTDDRLSARIARVFGWSDRTYRKARDVIAYAPDTVDGGELAARIESEMDSTGKVDGPHRAIRALAVIEEHARHDNSEVREMATSILSIVVNKPGFDLEAEAVGLVSFAEQQTPAGDDVADPTLQVDEHDVTQGGSDVSPPEAFEPTPAWKDLSAAQREAMAHLWREGSLRYSNTTTESTIYHVVADHLEALALVSITVPLGGTFDNRVVELTDLGVDVMCRFAEEWWPAQRNALSGLASDWELVEDYAPPSPWEEAGVVFERNGGAKFRALTIIGSTTALSQVLDTLDEAEDFLEASGFGTPTRAGGDDDADGKGSAGHSEMAAERDDSAAPAADEAGESASEPPATPGGARPEGWPPRAESHPSLTEMHEAGFRTAAAFSFAARVLMDLILEGDTPEEAVDRMVAGGKPKLSDEQLDYVLAHFDVPAPAPVASGGSESPALDPGVNEGVNDLEGDELVPDPSTEVEGEVSDGLVPPPARSDEGVPEFRRSGSPSPKHEPKPHPVQRERCQAVIEALEVLATTAQSLPEAEVVRYLATQGPTGGQAGSTLRSSLSTLVPYLTDLRALTIL